MDYKSQQYWEDLDDIFHEKVTLLVKERGYSPFVAEELVAQDMGFEDKWELKAHIQKLKAGRLYE